MNGTGKGQHNLDITSYTLAELLELYELPRQPTSEDMNRAKRKMLMMHPDKSHLPPTYFTFYRQAFSVVQQYYLDLNRTSQPVVNRDYEAPQVPNQEHIASQVQAKEDGRFQKQFNRLFEEKGGVDKERESRKQQRFGWFANSDDNAEASVAAAAATVKSAAGLNNAFESIRPLSLVVHRDFQPVRQGVGANAIDDGDDEEDQGYIANDMFSKLKYDDIRRVHKDQTVLPVGESDFQKVATYGSVEEYRKVRSAQSTEAMDKATAEQLLQQQTLAQQRQYETRWSKMQQQTSRHEENNASVLSSFLLLGDVSNKEPSSSSSSKGSEKYVNRSRMSCSRF